MSSRDTVREPVLSLSEVEPGRRVRVEAVHAGRALTARLADMGLLPGMEVEVIRGSSSGPVVLAVRDTRLMLGRGVVRKIEVRPGPRPDAGRGRPGLGRVTRCGGDGGSS